MGEQHSLLQRVNGLPVHEVTLYLGKYRNKGRAANTIHFVCSSLALLYRELDAAGVDLLERLLSGQFLTTPEMDRLVSAARYRAEDLEGESADGKSNVIDIRRIGIRRSQKQAERKPVDVQTFALKKEALRGNWRGALATPRDERVRTALEQVERLQSKVDRLTQENRLLKEQFVTWAHNAERKGVTIMMLNAPLPKPERERSKESH